MSGAATASARLPAGARPRLMEALQIDYHTTPFRAERFLELYSPAVARVLAYGAIGYVFYRSEDDPDHFVHLSFWDDRSDFDRYWFSREMQEVRERTAGLHGQPVLPHWSLILSRG